MLINPELKKLSIFAMASMLLAGAQADESRSSPAVAVSAEKLLTAAPAASTPSQKLVCEYESTTGTRLRTRVCKTEAQLEAEKKAAVAAGPLNLYQNQKVWK